MNHVNLLFFEKVNLWSNKIANTKLKIARYLITRGWSIIMIDVEVPLGKIVKAIKNE
jgi:hypothetical protein